MRDVDIRTELLRSLNAEFSGDPSTRIINELGLRQGECRIDVALVNGALHGYEIKSAADTLERLPAQAAVYNTTLDTVTLVCDRRHVDGATRLIPEWWAISEAVHVDGVTTICPRRAGGPNPSVIPESLAQLLWKEETLQILADLGLSKGMKSQPRRVLWTRLAASLPLDDLRALVRRQLKAREGWPAVGSPAQCDDSSQPVSRFDDSLTGLPWHTAARNDRPN